MFYICGPSTDWLARKQFKMLAPRENSGYRFPLCLRDDLTHLYMLFILCLIVARFVYLFLLCASYTHIFFRNNDLPRTFHTKNIFEQHDNCHTFFINSKFRISGED